MGSQVPEGSRSRGTHSLGVKVGGQATTPGPEFSSISVFITGDVDLFVSAAVQAKR